MFRSKSDTAPEEREMLVLGTRFTAQTNVPKTSPLRSFGIPRSSPRIWKSDLFLTSVCLICFVSALAIVFHSKTAILLGQVNQLIALGVLLQIMALCTQKHLQYFMLVCECLWNKSSLQNFESIMQANFVGPDTTLLLRLAILLYLTLPVVLGVAYKSFTGGSTTMFHVPYTSQYGWTGQPGTVALGTSGIALFYNATTPWWTSHEAKDVFGFNLHVESADRSALLDGPIESNLQQLQSTLGSGETLILNALVNATVCDMIFDLGRAKTTDNLQKWFDPVSVISLNRTLALHDQAAAITQYANDYRIKTNSQAEIDLNWTGNGRRFAMVTQFNKYGWMWNNTFIMTSRWNTRLNQSFGTFAQGFYLHRRRYNARWLITHFSITLSSAKRVDDSILPVINDIKLVGPQESLTIGNGYQTLHAVFPQVFRDFDWKYSGDLDASGRLLPQRQNITTDTTLVAAMEWSRLTAMAGIFNPWANMTDPYKYRLYSSPGTYDKTTPTLKRSPLLGGVLAVNPIIIVLTLIIRLIFLSDAPISKDFGLAALLAGIDKESLNMVKGAAYSGKLKRSVRIKFSTLSVTEDNVLKTVTGSNRYGTGVVTMKLEGEGGPSMRYNNLNPQDRNDRLKRNVVYE